MSQAFGRIIKFVDLGNVLMDIAPGSPGSLKATSKGLLQPIWDSTATLFDPVSGKNIRWEQDIGDPGYDTFRAFNPGGTWRARLGAEAGASLKFGPLELPSLGSENSDLGPNFVSGLGIQIDMPDSQYKAGGFATAHLVPVIANSLVDFSVELQTIKLFTGFTIIDLDVPCLKDFFNIGYKFNISYLQNPATNGNLTAHQKDDAAKNFWAWFVKYSKNQVWIEAKTYAGPDTIKNSLQAIADQNSKPLFDFGKIYTDHYFKMVLPVPLAAMKDFSGGLTTAYVDSISEYNFFINEYEQQVTNLLDGVGQGGIFEQENRHPDNLIPNMYFFLSEQKYLDDNDLWGNYKDLESQPPIAFDTNGDPIFSPHSTPYSTYLTLGGRVKNVLMDVMMDKQSMNVAGPINKIHKVGSSSPSTPDKIKVGEKDIGDYWKKWAHAIARVGSDMVDENEVILWQQWLYSFISPLKNICFLNYDTSIFEQAEQKKHLFPMHNKIEFSSDVLSGMSDLLQKTKLMYTFMDAIHQTNNSKIHRMTQYEVSNFAQPQAAVGDGLETNVISQTVLPSENIKSWDMSYVINQIKNNFSEEGALEVGFHELLPLGSKEELMTPEKTNKFLQALQLYKLKSLYKSYVQSLRRKHKQVLNGEPAHSETLFYRIEKMDSTGKTIQNIYIPNSSNSDIIKYYDTSVGYNRKYTYNIHAYVLVIGSMYAYNPAVTAQKFDSVTGWSPPFTGANIHTVETRVDNYPSVMIFEIPYSTQMETLIVDSPPLSPDVDIVPYRGIDNKLKFNFSSNTGLVFTNPIWFNDEEKAILEELKKAQQVDVGTPLDKSTVLKFESDDPIRKYEIYKIVPPESDSDRLPLPGFFDSYKPKKYSDFGQPYNVLEDMDSWIDYNIKPNKKYYYMFRAVDQHGHFSNPSPIFQVELINDSGAIYPLIEIVEFEKQTLKTTRKSFRKYLQIIPTYEQGLVQNMEEIKSAEDLGVPGNKTALGKTPKLGTVFSLEMPEGDNDAPARKFKIRLTSKSTGKKIDFNVRFTQKHDENKKLQLGKD